MDQQLFGRIVGVRSPLVDESGYLAVIWFVAIDDDAGAVAAVRSAASVGADDEMMIIGQLEPDAVHKLGLAPGQAITHP